MTVITDDQLVTIVESLRHIEHGLSARRLRAVVLARHGVRIPAGQLLTQARRLSDEGRLFVGDDHAGDPKLVKVHDVDFDEYGPKLIVEREWRWVLRYQQLVYPASYRAAYEARVARTVAEPAGEAA